MKILLLSPFFPPDPSPSANFTKFCAAELIKNGHEVAAIHYGILPEAVPQLNIVSIKKNQGLIRRLWTFTQALWHARKVDSIIIHNGPSVELPVIMLKPFLKAKIIYVIVDPMAIQLTTKIAGLINRLIKLLSYASYQPTPALIQKPIVHPLQNNEVSLTQWEKDLTEHCRQITNYV